ncbi:hypothetical protein SVAN01_01661 [Stagonosporopsis vannaccii]|nr:hypothetical protein SVAN01_01661 [Stagonosporopsis vannaccii]
MGTTSSTSQSDTSSILSQHNTSSVAASLHFNTYKDYEEHVKAIPRVSTHGYDAWPDYWLAEVLTSGQGLRWFRFQGHTFGKYPTPDMSGFVSYDDGQEQVSTTRSSKVFSERLAANHHDISYRLLMVNRGRLSWNSPDLDYDEVADIIGIELDIPPAVWDHLRDRRVGGTSPTKDDSRNRTAKWVENSPVLDIGESSLVVLDHGRVSTAFLNLSKPLDDRSDTLDHTSAYPMDPPSQAMTGSKRFITPAPGEAHETRFLRRHLQDNIGPPHRLDPLLVCFRALVELHLCKAPLNIPLLTDSPSSRDIAVGRYADLSMDMRSVWSRLRQELDSHRMQAVHMARYVTQRFSAEQQLLCSDLLARFDIRLRGLDVIEATLRDHIAIQSSAISTEMAKQSIRESKRVTLVTILAFILLPVSVASSIYGMNVQQINQTGPSIVAFVITAIALCAGCGMLWGFAALAMSYREYIIKTYTTAENSWYTRHNPEYRLHNALINGPGFGMRRVWDSALIRRFRGHVPAAISRRLDPGHWEETHPEAGKEALMNL